MVLSAPGGSLVIAGVSGSGKTTVADLVADALGWSAIDADALHSDAAIRKMASGHPLTDEDRWPWLERVAASLAGESEGVVVACSALRRRYRTLLAERVPDLVFCWLNVSAAEAARRVGIRRGHFMPPTLLGSQFADVDPMGPSERGFSVDGDQPSSRVLVDVLRRLQTCGAAPEPWTDSAEVAACAP